jgi:hypothetical protein
MTAAIELVTPHVRDWLIEHGHRVGRLARLGDYASRGVVHCYAMLQQADDADVHRAVERVRLAIETWETVWGDD